MWATLAFAAALSLAPHQDSGLKFSNDRATYGLLGPTRPDNDFLPGEIYFLAFDIEGLKMAEDGKVEFKQGMELVNAQGNKTEFKEDARDIDFVNSLGGNRTPSIVFARIGIDTAPGDYVFRVTVTDRGTSKSETLERKFKVLPKAFGLVRMSVSTLPLGSNVPPQPAPPLAVPGQSIMVNCAAVGFDRDKTTKQPNLTFKATVLDEKGEAVGIKAISDTVTKDVPEDRVDIPITFPISLNRAGKFTVVVEGTDRITMKTVKASMPLQVVDLK